MKTNDKRTDCCGAFSTYVEGVLCCKACYREVNVDGSERKPESLPPAGPREAWALRTGLIKSRRGE